MRWLILGLFEQNTKPYIGDIKTVALVGGSSHDPELASLKREGILNVDYFGIEPEPGKERFKILDLNEKTIMSNSYDLVICSQVLEHVWNQAAAFENLCELTKPGGWLWIGCPASNFPHGAPDYFSAGYTSSMIANNLRKRGLSILSEGMVGSDRYYSTQHVFRYWLTESEHRSPLLGYKFRGRNSIRKLGKMVIDLPKMLFAESRSPKITTSVEFATESYVFARKS